jgi:hypothetical protein
VKVAAVALVAAAGAVWGGTHLRATPPAQPGQAPSAFVAASAAPPAEAAHTDPPDVARAVPVESLPVSHPGPRHPRPHRVPAPSASPEPTPPPAPIDPGSLAEETRLLRQAQEAFDRGDAQGALALARQHEAKYPNGTLYEERMVLRILALCALGRPAEAGAVARQVLRSAPGSPHLAGIRASCAGPELE